LNAVIIDDHEGIAELVANALQPWFPIDAIRVYSSYSHACDCLAALKPRLVIVDLRIHHHNGLDIVREFSVRLPDTRWLLYSGFASANSLKAAIQAGIDGAVAKRAPLSVLRSAVEQILLGNRYFCQITSSELRHSHEARVFSTTEMQILENVSLGHQPKEIAAILGLAHKTILNGLVGIREKTGMESMVQLSDFARSNGLTKDLISQAPPSRRR